LLAKPLMFIVPLYGSYKLSEAVHSQAGNFVFDHHYSTPSVIGHD
jgi:hypothetical protein